MICNTSFNSLKDSLVPLPLLSICNSQWIVFLFFIVVDLAAGCTSHASSTFWNLTESASSSLGKLLIKSL